MDDNKYIISDASKLVDVEQHTLRYWEEELKLDIERNGLGHRLYSEDDITTFKRIKNLKDQGFQLKAIKMVLPDIDKLENIDPESLVILKERMNDLYTNEDGTQIIHNNHVLANTDDSLKEIETSSEDRMGQFRRIMKDIVTGVLKENNVELAEAVSVNVTNSVIKEMDYVLRMKEEREEERYKQFDRMLRDYQNSKSHAAATKSRRRKKGLFSKEM